MTYPILEDGVAMETPDAQVAINNWVTNFKRLSQERDWLEIERDRLAKELADARVGMVPEGELAELQRFKDFVLQSEDTSGVGLICSATHPDDAADLAAQTIEKLRAERAKAWEEGAQAQREADKDTLFDNDYREATWFIDKHPLVQPPGGKAK